MNTFRRFLLTFALSGTFSVLFGASPFEAPGENDGVSINQTEMLVYPYLMTQRGILTGEAQVVISVDAEGKLNDVLAVGYTNVAFADVAIGALKRWSYEPARVHGVPRASRAYVIFKFKNDMGVMIQKLPNFNDASVLRFQDERYVFTPCKLRDLDRIPIPTEVVAPVPPKGGLAATRVVTVEFYIDDQGHVRMPAIERSDADDVYAAAAVRAVEKMAIRAAASKRAASPGPRAAEFFLRTETVGIARIAISLRGQRWLRWPFYAPVGQYPGALAPAWFGVGGVPSPHETCAAKLKSAG